MNSTTALSKAQAVAFIRTRSDLFDRQANPFSHSAYLTHFIDNVAGEDWMIHATEVAVDGPSDTVLLTYEAPGTPRQALCNYYASLFSPVITACGEVADAAAAVARVVTTRPRPPTLQLAPLSRLDAALLGDAFRSEGWFAKRYFCFGNWYLPCQGATFGAYLASRPSQLRHTLARKSRSFFSNSASRIQVVTDPADVDDAMAAYDRVFLKSWKRPEPYPHFIKGWARICASEGWLRMGIAWVGEVPVAVQFWFFRAGRAYIYKLAYDEDYARLSAGTVLTAHMFRHALDVDHASEIDYLTGDDPYKRDWMTHRRERVGLLACDLRSPKGLIRAAFETAGTVKKQLQRRGSADKAFQMGV